MVNPSQIRFRIISYHRLSRTQEAEKTFPSTSSSASIGRGDQCDWTLPDPARVISGTHARVLFQDDQFQICDESTNGVFLNDDESPLGKGNLRPLKKGDLIALGDYELEVAAIEAVARPDEPSAALTADTAPPAYPDPGAKGYAAPPQDIDPFQLGMSSDAFRVPSPATMMAGSRQPAATGNTRLPAANAVGPARSEPEPAAENNSSFIPESFDQQFPPGDTPGARLSEPTDPAPVSEAQSRATPEIRIPTQAAPETTPAPQQTTAAQSGPAENDAFYRSFVKALGIADETQLKNLSPEALGNNAGLLMRELFDGLLQLMRTRDAVKTEFRASQTRIQTGDNNPLKFSATAEDAIFNLLIQTRPSFMGPLDAVRQANQDLAQHQLGMLRGMRQVFGAVVGHFDPEQIKARQAETGGKLNRLAPKAGCWDRFRELHQMLADHGESLQSYFSDQFLEAYERPAQEGTNQ